MSYSTQKAELTTRLDPSHPAFDNLIKYAIAPRPICLASTINSRGEVNLSPFSYFNLFSHNPPICVFSPLRRMRDGTTKHTLHNLQEVQEVVINIVDFSIVQQQSLASTEYGEGVNEFVKSGLTPIPSELIEPPRVLESPVQLECKVREFVTLGDEPGNGTLVVAEVVRMHVRSALLDQNQQVNQAELDLVARLGGDWYCRVHADNLFIVPKPLRKLGIGVDALPESIQLSKVLTGNQLGLLANVESFPSINSEFLDELQVEISEIFDQTPALVDAYHRKAAFYLDQGEVEKAWQILLHAL